MPERKDRAVFTFTMAHQAMVAEDILHDVGLTFQVVPPPRELSAGCGLALRVALEDVPAALAALRREGASYQALHRLGVDQKLGDKLG